jgi:hypothetical protein
MERPAPAEEGVEFVGRFEEQGWSLASEIVPITYVAWLSVFGYSVGDVGTELCPPAGRV